MDPVIVNGSTRRYPGKALLQFMQGMFSFISPWAAIDWDVQRIGRPGRRSVP